MRGWPLSLVFGRCCGAVAAISLAGLASTGSAGSGWTFPPPPASSRGRHGDPEAGGTSTG
jgi:hypothetical protein